MKKRSLILCFAIALATIALASCTPMGASVSKEEARMLAVDHFGLDLESCTMLRTEYDDGRYEVEFVFAGNEYEVEVDARTGVVTETDVDGDGSYREKETQASKDRLTEDEAKSVAFSHFNLEAASCTVTHMEYDEGKYEIEFICGDKKYEVDINAKTGAVIDADVDSKIDMYD